MRNGLSIVAAASCAALLAACATGPVAPPSPVALFDSHAHLMTETLSNDQEIALLKQVGLSRVLLMSPEPQRLAVLAKTYPGFVVPALSTGRANAPGVHLEASTGPAMAKAYADHRTCAFGEITGAQIADNADFAALYAVAESTGGPLVLHVDLARPDAVALVEKAASAHPKMRLILAHLGWTAGPALIGRLLDAHPNLYTDLSIRFDAPGSLAWRNAGLDLSILTKDQQIPPDWLAVMQRHPDRFLFATDINSFGPRYTIEADLVATAHKALDPLPRPLREAIGHGNAERLLKGCGGV